MSRIQILLAEEESIDDLKMPVRFGQDFFDAVQEHDNRRMAEAILGSSKGIFFEDLLADEARFGLGDDDGEPCMFFENFLELCEGQATRAFDGIIEQQHLDISDEDYADIIRIATDLIADYYADYESVLCADALADWKRDNKFSLDEARERNGQC